MTLVIAEVSSNHLGSIDNALELISGSAKAGADFVKFQLYNIHDDIQLIENVEYQEELKTTANKDIETIGSFVVDLDWLPELAQKSKESGISLLFSCSDINLLKLAKEFSTQSIIKIASCDATNLSLLAKSTYLFEEIIVSTGAISLSECFALKTFIYDHLSYTGKLSFLYCVSEYPTAKSISACMASLCFEPYIVEKHIMLENRISPDSPVSCNADSLSHFMEVIRLKNAANSVDYKLLSSDMRDVMLRRSPFTMNSSDANLSIENFDYVRPGYGMNLLDVVDNIDSKGMLATKVVRKAWGLE